VTAYFRLNYKVLLRKKKYIKNTFQVAQWKNVLYFGAKSKRRYRRLTEIIRACALRIHFKSGLLEKDI